MVKITPSWDKLRENPLGCFRGVGLEPSCSRVSGD